MILISRIFFEDAFKSFLNFNEKRAFEKGEEFNEDKKLIPEKKIRNVRWRNKKNESKRKMFDVRQIRER